MVSALGLALLSPLIAEYLLGDFSVRQIGFLAVLLPQYGAGAILIRELARRNRRGWPTMLWLALAYALVEEGLTTQSLFNPNYAGQRLLDYGYVPLLGTSFVWAVFVLTLHVVWSMGSAIALAEALSGDRWNTPWLGARAFGVIVVLYVAGCAFTTISTRYLYPFVASAGQFAAVAVAAGAAIWIAFLFSGGKKIARRGPPPPAFAIAASTFVLASAFHLLHDRTGSRELPPAVLLSGMILLELLAAALLLAWSRRRAWGPAQTLAAASGAILTYSWLGLRHMQVRGATALGVPTTNVDVAGQAALIGLMVVLIAVGWGRLRVAPAVPPVATRNG